MRGGRSRVISPILPSVSINQVCSMLTIYALMNVGPRLCRDTLKQYMHYECRTYVVKSNPQRFWIITCMATVEFTGSVDIILITLKDAPSSSSSIRLLFTQIDDKDETDDTIKSMMLHLIR